MAEWNKARWGSWLNVGLLSRLRRNHALEHATLHVLSQRDPRRTIAGHSDLGGFWILGEVSTEELKEAVEEALFRLRAGEWHLAVHPNCGTNFVAAGVLAGLGAFLAMIGTEKKWRAQLERLPLAISLATVAVMFAQPVGLSLQREVTTQGNPEQLEVIQIIPTQRGRFKAHRVLTRG